MDDRELLEKALNALALGEAGLSGPALLRLAADALGCRDDTLEAYLLRKAAAEQAVLDLEPENALA